MPSYLISYDLRKRRDYPSLYNALNKWNAVKLLQSVWLADLTGTATAIRDLLKAHIDDDDGLAVIELKNDFDWATRKPLPGSAEWLQARSP